MPLGLDLHWVELWANIVLCVGVGVLMLLTDGGLKGKYHQSNHNIKYVSQNTVRVPLSPSQRSALYKAKGVDTQ